MTEWGSFVSLAMIEWIIFVIARLDEVKAWQSTILIMQISVFCKAWESRSGGVYKSGILKFVI
ncbi:MAG: hypothetical protein PUB96_06805 [Helicobacteraceae bacterium]|nr:hypothetical protein [Helicobacteraceae bacterium]